MPRGLIEPDAAHQFCCAGCRGVYQLLHDQGLDAFYRIQRRDPGTPTPAAALASTPGQGFAAFADPAFETRHCRALDEHTRSVDLVLEGVHCAACVWLVEKLPRLRDGVIEARLSLRDATVRLRWDRRTTDLPAIARTLNRLGYRPHPAQGRSARALRTAQDRRDLIRIAVAGACAGNLMLIAVALYAGMFSAMEAQYEALFRYLSLGLGLVALAWPGSVFFRGAIAALRTRTTHLDLPIALALAVGGSVGVFHVVTGRGDIYFDTLGVLVFLLLVGRFIQHRQQRRAADALDLLFSLTPATARRVEGDAVHEVPVEALSPGDTVEVLAGQTIPADGTLTTGPTELDQALLTGESRPVAAGPGDPVWSGTVNLATTLRLCVRATGRQTRVGRLMRRVEDLAAGRSPMVQLADRIAGVFVLVVLALAALTLGLWLWLDPAVAFDHTVALLIVACPCALGLATPLTFAVAIGTAARRDILIKGADTLERLDRARRRGGTVLLDKTGTLTAGKTDLVHWHGSDAHHAVAAAVEAHAAHRIAAAISAGFDAAELPAVEQVTGHDAGITARWNGQRVLIGSPDFCARHGVERDERTTDHIAACRAQCLSPVVMALDSRAVAVAGCGDALRPGSTDAVMRLGQRGLTPIICSGDDPAVVVAVARRVGLDADAGGAMARQTPEQKVQAVRHHAGNGPVVMVGDGVNDAGALAAADVGVAVCGGAEAALATADVYLARPGLTPLLELLDLSHRALRVVRVNLAVSLSYNAGAMGLAMAGLINPLVAAVLMPASSFTVLALALAHPHRHRLRLRLRHQTA